MDLSSVEIKHQRIQLPIRVPQPSEVAEDAYFPWCAVFLLPFL